MSARAGSTTPDCFAIVGFERRRPEEPEDELDQEEEDLFDMNDNDDADGGFHSVSEFDDSRNDGNSLENQDHLGDSKDAALAGLSPQNHLGSPDPSNCPTPLPVLERAQIIKRLIGFRWDLSADLFDDLSAWHFPTAPATSRIGSA